MANEVQFSFKSGSTCYFLTRNNVGQIWNTTTNLFESYSTANFTAGKYQVSATEQGSASAFYAGTFPSAIAAGIYGITAKQQIGGSAAETDPTIAVGDFNWNGLTIIPLSDLSTSGQVGSFAPIKISRGSMIQNFPFYLVSSADHNTPFTSGVCSGQISRDSGAFVALQSGSFFETGLGFYRVQALTSGDLLANTASLVFTANGISGGTSDPRPFTLILQRTSGN